MIDQLWQLLDEQLKTNQFLSGGLFLGALSAALYHLKSVPRQLYQRIKALYVITVDIPDREDAFKWLDNWLSQHPYSQKRARLLTVRCVTPSTDDVSMYDETEDYDQPATISFSPSPGNHWFFYRGRLVNLYRERKDGADKGLSLSIRESFVLRVYTRNRQLVKDLLDEARAMSVPNKRQIQVLGWSYSCWSRMSFQPERPLSSVVLADGVMEDLIRKIEDFYGRKDWYHDRGIPWRLGILLSGPPGSGKTSTVAALATYFRQDIAILNVNDISSDSELLKSVGALPERSVLLLEDIDALFEQRESKKKDKGVTFSGLINAIDGIAAGEGRVLIMSTNYKEKLDSALIRPGRADIHLEIGVPTPAQRKHLFQRFFPEAKLGQTMRFVENCKLESMAGIQAYLLGCKDAEEAATNAWKAAL